VSGAPTIGRVVVAGGSGAVGWLFAERLQEAGNDVVIVDLAGPGPARSGTGFVRGDVGDPDAGLTDLVRTADAVLLSVPEPVALVAIGRLAGALRPDALIADTLSVKTTVVRALRAAALVVGDEAEALSLNPMFAPSLGFADHAVASVVVRDGRRGRALRDLIEQWGARVVPVTADQHDRMAAATQVLTPWPNWTSTSPTWTGWGRRRTPRCCHCWRASRRAHRRSIGTSRRPTRTPRRLAARWRAGCRG
jgi:4-amino-4-deoxyprephenate dehydrogenase